MSKLIKNIDFFMASEKEQPNVAIVELNPNGATALVEGETVKFQSFVEQTEKFDGFLPMSINEDIFMDLAKETVAELGADDRVNMVIYMDTNTDGFMPLELNEIKKYTVDHAANGHENSPHDRKELNELYRLQNTDNEKVTNPEFQELLDTNALTEDNMEDVFSKATFLMPIKLGKKNIKNKTVDFFLLNNPEEPSLIFLPVFTDWKHLEDWYFSPAGAGFKETTDREVLVVPSGEIMGMISGISGDVTAIVVNPITNDFIIGLEADNNQ